MLGLIYLKIIPQALETDVSDKRKRGLTKFKVIRKGNNSKIESKIRSQKKEKKTQTSSITLLALVSLAFVKKNHSVGCYSWIIQQFYLAFRSGNNSYADRTNKAETRVCLSMSCLVTLLNLQPIRQILEERS